MARLVGQGLRAKTAVSTSLAPGSSRDQPRGLRQRQAGVEHVVHDQRLAARDRALQVGAHLAAAAGLPLVPVGGQPQGVEAHHRGPAAPGPGSGRRRTTGRRSAGRRPRSRRRCAARSRAASASTRSATSASEIRTAGSSVSAHVLRQGVRGSRAGRGCGLGAARRRPGGGGRRWASRPVRRPCGAAALAAAGSKADLQRHAAPAGGSGRAMAK